MLANLTPEQEKSLIYESDLILDLDLCWKPHPAQIKIKNALFGKGKKRVFIECGRKFGKSEMLIYLLYRYALLYPNSACYYIAPLQKQARELIWANNRIQNFFQPLVDQNTNVTHKGHTREQAQQIFRELTNKYSVEVNNTEMRVKFGNGSFIKLDGADQHQAYRGVNPHIIVYDEFKDHHPEFHKAMDPNRVVFKAPLVVVGTPPEGDEDNEKGFVDLSTICSSALDSCYFNFTSYSNPYIDRSWLDQTKKELIATGNEDVWLREYMAKRVKRGSRSIFPMFECPDDFLNVVHTRHFIPYAEGLARVKRFHKDWDYAIGYDPASVSVFAVLLVAINRRSKEVIFLDEVYETDKGKMSTTQIYPRAMRMLEGLPITEDDAREIYDNAAAWFANEVANQYKKALEPCIKDKNKEDKLNLLKDMLLYGYLTMTDRCVNTAREYRDYRTDDKGRIPKEGDHNIDNSRYILSNFYYTQVPRHPLKAQDPDRRGFTMEEDFKEDMKQRDPFYNINQEYYHV